VRARGRLDLASTFADSRPRAATLIYTYLGSPNTLIDGKARHLVAPSTIQFDHWVRGLPTYRRCPLRTGALSRHYSTKNDGAVGTVLLSNSSDTRSGTPDQRWVATPVGSDSARGRSDLYRSTRVA
jgi:hypothetical protein